MLLAWYINKINLESVLEFFQTLDEYLFYFINVNLSNTFTDKLMPFITERSNWFIFYILVWLYLIFKGGIRGKVVALLIIILIVATDQFSNNVLKPYFERIRPCNGLPNVHLLIGCSNSYSFPSIHAVNNFAAATLFSYFYPNMKYFLFVGATIVALSRVFCGIHYPFDIIGGALIGILFGLSVVYLWNLINNKFHIIKI